MKPLPALIAATLALTAAPAPAAEVIFGVGQSAYLFAGARNSTVLSVEVRGPVLGPLGRGTVTPMLVLDRHALGDSFVGLGLAARWPLRQGWFFDAGLAPGAYHAAVAANGLGGTLEFRTHLALGRDLGRGQAVSVAFVHKSNAGTGRVNPGMHGVSVRWHQAF